jgi:hypothetical protein
VLFGMTMYIAAWMFFVTGFWKGLRILFRLLVIACMLKMKAWQYCATAHALWTAVPMGQWRAALFFGLCINLTREQ